MYNFKHYFETTKKYNYLWNQRDNSFAKPGYLIAKPLEQCSFVMTRLDRDKKPYPVDMWGSRVDPDIYGVTDFSNNARPLWVDGQSAFFDGYSIVLPNQPSPVYVEGYKHFVVAGIYDNCVTWKGKDATFSTEFIADRMALERPLMWFTPDRKGICWAGLSDTPIVGGTSKSKKISSFGLTIPITTFFIREDAPPDSDEDFLTPLPKNANKTITGWFEEKVAA
ncbi:MAG: hypothetical protein K9J14_04875 [Polynucleobacter sp.]|nr:hypothetical protein [Polynucleobacter sp.]